VTERWVCKRCFASNNEGDSACQRCGLIRGAESTPTDQATWASQGGIAPPAAQPGWRRWARYWWIPALAIFLGVGYLASARRDDGGSITGGGTLSIEDLRIGDCFNSDDTDEISSVDARPCTEAHDYELFHIATWTTSSDYPAEDAMIDFVIQECIPAFTPYVGRTYEASQLDFVHFYPLEEGWDAGDRVFQCALFDPGQDDLTESLRGADR